MHVVAGFLSEPGEFRYLRGTNDHLRRLDDLDDVGCVLLVGDPSLGKSYEIEDYVARLVRESRAIERYEPGLRRAVHSSARHHRV